MRNIQFRFILSAAALLSVWTTATLSASAAPVKFERVRQIINAKPGKAATGAFAHLRLVGDEPTAKNGGDDKTKTGDNPPAPSPTTQQDDERVIVETSSEIVEDDVCDCSQPTVEKGRFPYALLALGAVPLLFLIPRGKDTPTPTPPETPPTTETPTPTTPTPTQTPTPPPVTPTPTPPEPVPEPMTILLFGTGLAGVGMAARKRFGKQEKTDDAPEIQ